LEEFKTVVERCIPGGSFQKPQTDHLATQLLRWQWSFGLIVQNHLFKQMLVSFTMFLCKMTRL